MENFSQLTLVLCLTFIGILVINAGIILWARRNAPSGEVQAFRRLANAAKNPLSRQANELDELSELVARYKETPANPSSEEESVEQ